MLKQGCEVSSPGQSECTWLDTTGTEGSLYLRNVRFIWPQCMFAKATFCELRHSKHSEFRLNVQEKHVANQLTLWYIPSIHYVIMRAQVLMPKSTACIMFNMFTLNRGWQNVSECEKECDLIRSQSPSPALTSWPWSSIGMPGAVITSTSPLFPMSRTEIWKTGHVHGFCDVSNCTA